MDLLVVVGETSVPTRILQRTSHVIHTNVHGMSPELIAHVRGHVPRTVGVTGSLATAQALQHSGFATTLYTDNPKELGHPDAAEAVEILPLHDPGLKMDVADDILQLVGSTPLVRLDRTGKDVKPNLIAKLEYLNPGGSVKDRPSITMIEEAERKGLLKSGGTIVEPTSGNTGVGLALVAARKKYKCVFVVPDKVALEKIDLLRAYGAEVVVCPTAVAADDPESYYSVSDRLAVEIPGAYKPNQYANPANPAAHEQSTGPEIWDQTKGRVTHFVAGIGTAGTIVGIARYLKRQNPRIQIIGADPEGSVYSGGSGRPYLVEGIGKDSWPKIYDETVIDRVVAVSDRDSFRTARRMTHEEGILTGGSAGTAVWAALKVSEELSYDDVVVVLIPDSGRGYLSKLYNDAWFAGYGFSRSQGPTVADVLASKDASIPDLVHVHPHELVRDVISTMREFGVSQVIAVKAEPPLVMGEVVGTLSEEDLLHRAFTDPRLLDQPVNETMNSIPPTIGTGESVDVAISRLEKNTMLLVVDSGHPTGIITRSDLLEYLMETRA